MRNALVSRESLLLAVLVVLLMGALGSRALQAEESASSAHAPDLRLEWPDRGREPIRGAAGEVVDLHFLLRNVGGGDAYAVVLSMLSPLGRHRRWRLQPGPAKGSTKPLETQLALSIGLTEVCLEATLQTLSASDPEDSRPQDNRICRPVQVSQSAKDDRAQDTEGELKR